jgi:hypothetical protein
MQKIFNSENQPVLLDRGNPHLIFGKTTVNKETCRLASSTLNHSHEHHLAMRAFSAAERLPGCFDGFQPFRGTRYDGSSLTDQ